MGVRRVGIRESREVSLVNENFNGRVKVIVAVGVPSAALGAGSSAPFVASLPHCAQDDTEGDVFVGEGRKTPLKLRLNGAPESLPPLIF